jgi:hypothetical protein
MQITRRNTYKIFFIIFCILDIAIGYGTFTIYSNTTTTDALGQSISTLIGLAVLGVMIIITIILLTIWLLSPKVEINSVSVKTPVSTSKKVLNILFIIILIIIVGFVIHILSNNWVV